MNLGTMHAPPPLLVLLSLAEPGKVPNIPAEDNESPYQGR